MIVLIVAIFILLVLLVSVQPHQSIHSQFELRRRLEHGGSKAELEVVRHQVYGAIIFWLRIKELLLVVTFILLFIYTYGLTRGLIVGVLSILGYKVISRIPVVYRLAQKLYDSHEKLILRGVQKLQPISNTLQRPFVNNEPKVASRKELAHIIGQSRRFFTKDEYALLKSAMVFSDLVVRDYMTPYDSIDAIAVDELLGPLVLDDLHKTGHHRFPVTDGDINHVVGVLDVRDLLVMGDKKSPRVKQVMDDQVFYVSESQTLGSTLSAFLQTGRHLLIVIDAKETTVGVLSLGDVVSTLMGRTIEDEFDEYDNRHAVATRGSTSRGNPGKI